MGIIKDEAAQTAAEFLLLFGGIMVIVIVALIVYRNYVEDMTTDINNSSEVKNITDQLDDINSALN